MYWLSINVGIWGPYPPPTINLGNVTSHTMRNPRQGS